MSGELPEALLLDTCALIWLANGDPLPDSALAAIFHAGRHKGTHVSPISAWEIGLLSRPGNRSAAALTFMPDAKTWFARFLARPGIRLAPLTPEIAIGASHLPGELHGDPGDRLLIATARDQGMPIVTRDRRIIDYASQGHLQLVRC